VQLAHDAQDVLGRTLERRAHRVQAIADAVLGGESALDLGDVRGRARLGAAEADDGEVGGGHGA
jgi:hypothetical protein